MLKSNVSIIGLGWLGLPLYHYLTKHNFSCKGSTTSTEKKEHLESQNVSAFQIKLNETGIEGSISDCLKGTEILILNTPPGLRRNPESSYVSKVEQLIPYIERSSIKKVLYISSTSVFKDEEHFPEVTNSTLPNSTSIAGIQIRKVENILTSNANFKTTVLRFAGLVNDQRHPATMMSKRPLVKNPKAPVNLIHREDCIGIIKAILDQEKWGEIYNASYPKHLNKQTYYNAVCDAMQINRPNFDTNSPSKGKLINGKEITTAINYTYKYVV